MLRDELSYSGGPAETRPNRATELKESVFNDIFARTSDPFVYLATMDRLELSEGEMRLTRGTVMPMNSKRLTKTYLSRIAEKLELPTKASAEETRQIIEGKLLEMGREPHNVQVELEAREEDSEFILLRDVDGVFLEIEPPTKEPVEDGTGSLF